MAMAAAVAAVLALLAGACGWDDGGHAGPTTLPGEDQSQHRAVRAADLGPFAVEASHGAGPETPLGGGLVVPRGAVLLGIPFPDIEGGGFRALMVVTGDPVEVYDEVVAQAVALGMERQGSCLGGPQEVTCRGHLADRADGESLAVEVRRAVVGSVTVSGLALRYLPPGGEDAGGSGGLAPDAPAGPLVPVALPPTVVPPPPEDVGLGLHPPDAPARAVEVGSTLVGLPGPCACGGPGWSFVVAVDGRVRDIVAAYARQFSDLGQPPDASDDYRGERTTYFLRVGEGERTAEVRAVSPEDGTTYLMVTVAGA